MKTIKDLSFSEMHPEGKVLILGDGEQIGIIHADRGTFEVRGEGFALNSVQHQQLIAKCRESSEEWRQQQ